MGRFFNGKVRNDKNALIKYGVIAGGVLLIIIILILIISSAGKDRGTLTLKSKLSVEVNTELPDKLEFFEEFENFNEDDVTIDYNDADISVVGSYMVTISAKGRDQVDVELEVVDTTPPTLTAKTYTINEGDSYYPEDFVGSCVDNYDTDCGTIEYYNGYVDQQGNTVNFASYTEIGTYTIMIIATDSEGNTSDPQTTQLIIQKEGQGGATTPTNCDYGDLTVSTDLSYPVAVIVGDKNTQCAVNRDVWDNGDVQKPVNEFYNTDYERLKGQLTSILEDEYPDGAKIVAYPHYIAVLNKDLKGLVGYAIYVKVYVANADATGSIDTTDNLKLAYYLNSDKTREYDVNAFDLAK